MNNINKIVRLGKGEYGNVYCKIEYKDNKLSISGVQGPHANGNCKGSCGQIVDGLAKAITVYAPGWGAASVKTFAAIWNRWHLNDSRAGCEHQRAENWGEESIEVITYKLTSEAHRLRNAALEEATKAAREGRIANLSDTGRALISPDWFVDKFTPPDADGPLSGMYEVNKREMKHAGWVRVGEHPRGVLCKPCPICGYEYGSKWLKEEIPTEVLEYLNSLPATDIAPAWI